jgi:glycine cleavage system aminomethyltransferase T
LLCALGVLGGEENPTAYGGEAAYAGGKVLERVPSRGYGYTVKKNIGYAYLPLHLAQEGTRLEVEVFGERVPARVVQDALYDPKGARLRE